MLNSKLHNARLARRDLILVERAFRFYVLKMGNPEPSQNRMTCVNQPTENAELETKVSCLERSHVARDTSAR